MTQMSSCETPRFGRVEYAETDVIVFPAGIMPFAWATRFVMLSRDEEAPFAWLQSLDDPRLAFAVAPLEVFFPDHAARTWGRIGATRDGVLCPEARLYGIVVLDADPSRMTVNLLAPIILAPTTMTAEQVVLDGPIEMTRERLEPALRALAAA